MFTTIKPYEKGDINVLDDFGAFTFKCFVLSLDKQNNVLLTAELLEGAFLSFTYGLMKVCSDDKKKRLVQMMSQARSKFMFGELYDLIYDVDIEETKVYLSELIRRLGMNTINPLKESPKEVKLIGERERYNVKTFLAYMFMNGA